MSNEDKQTILRFLAANGKCENPNPTLGPIHRYSLREEIEKQTNNDGEEYNARNRLDHSDPSFSRLQIPNR